MPLPSELGGRLLRWARSQIELAILGTATRPDLEPWPDLPRCGVFVTLRTQEQLRGCIGTFVATDALPDTIRRMTLAALHDPRFLDCPISAEELSRLHIELSLLSALRRLSDPLDFEIGRHGVYVRRGNQIGCFLPDVASERGWDQATFLSRCCSEKADLDAAAWSEPGTEVYCFTVDKLSE